MTDTMTVAVTVVVTWATLSCPMVEGRAAPDDAQVLGGFGLRCGRQGLPIFGVRSVGIGRNGSIWVQMRLRNPAKWHDEQHRAYAPARRPIGSFGISQMIRQMIGRVGAVQPSTAVLWPQRGV